MATKPTLIKWELLSFSDLGVLFASNQFASAPLLHDCTPHLENAAASNCRPDHNGLDAQSPE
jgi:hypothetical protein